MTATYGKCGHAGRPVYFIGTGPGDPELLTLKGRRIIEQADVIVYADSLINDRVLEWARPGAAIFKSASLTLEETHQIISDAAREGKTVARLQSGDAGLYGAIHEQMRLLHEAGIGYEVVPGVSSLFAAAAALKKELTVPEVSQTIIITRLAGKTPVPALEKLRSLAAHRATLAIFLSIALVEAVVRELLAGGYRPSTACAVVYRASWPDEKIVRATLADLVEAVRQAGITRQALILVGDFLADDLPPSFSRLYDKGFEHGYRA